MLGYTGLAGFGEFGSDAAILPRLLIVTFLLLPFAIWLSLALVGPAVTSWCLYLLWARKAISAPLDEWVSLGTDC